MWSLFAEDATEDMNMYILLKRALFIGVFVLMAGQDMSQVPRLPFNSCVLGAVDCFSSSLGSAQCFKA